MKDIHHTRDQWRRRETAPKRADNGFTGCMHLLPLLVLAALLPMLTAACDTSSDCVGGHICDADTHACVAGCPAGTQDCGDGRCVECCGDGDCPDHYGCDAVTHACMTACACGSSDCGRSCGVCCSSADCPGRRECENGTCLDACPPRHVLAGDECVLGPCGPGETTCGNEECVECCDDSACPGHYGCDGVTHRCRTACECGSLDCGDRCAACCSELDCPGKHACDDASGTCLDVCPDGWISTPTSPDCIAPCADVDQNSCTVEWYNVTLGKCVAAPFCAPDGLVCTSDGCLPGSEPTCVYTPVQCGDEGDRCYEHACTEPDGCARTVPVVCEAPADPCSVSSCDPTLGCIVTPLCNNTEDVCRVVEGVGVCVPDATECSSDVDCRDANACTRDTCDIATGRCAHATHPWPCECTSDDQCGIPLGVSGCGCSWCDRGLCRAIRACDDGDAATDDTCPGVDGPCIHAPSSVVESGASACASALAIIGHWGSYGTWPGFGEWLATLDSPGVWDGMPATSTPLTCGALRAAMANANATAPRPFLGPLCADGDLCSRDSCDPEHCGVCVHERKLCRDADRCTEDACDAATGDCVHVAAQAPDVPVDETGCTAWECAPQDGNWYQRPTPDSCVAPSPSHCVRVECTAEAGCQTVALDCRDDSPCTVDTCDADLFVCVHTPVDCADDDLATTDSCVPATGACAHVSTGCVSPDRCHAADMVGQTCVVSPLDCDDSNACTDDSCLAQVGCVHTPRSCPASANDSLCSRGVCDPTDGACKRVPKRCDDTFDFCSTHTCDEATGMCVHTPRDACPEATRCEPGSCVPATGQCAYAPDTCDDGNACNVDYCSEQDGCRHVAEHETEVRGDLVLVCDHMTGIVGWVHAACEASQPVRTTPWWVFVELGLALLVLVFFVVASIVQHEKEH
jgi:hypothetical protein